MAQLTDVEVVDMLKITNILKLLVKWFDLKKIDPKKSDESDFILKK